jgi:hypothetical protein
MVGKRFVRLAVFLALICASPPVSLAGHAHDSCNDAIHCALCSFASSLVALGSRPPQIPTPAARLERARRGVLQLTTPDLQVANPSRAPPGLPS